MKDELRKNYLLRENLVMDAKETAKQIRQILTLLLEGGYVMPIILTSIDRYGSLMVAEYTFIPRKTDHWHCEMLAERMKSALFEPPINMLFVDARGEVARVVFDAAGERRILHRSHGSTRGVWPREGIEMTDSHSPSKPVEFKSAFSVLRSFCGA
jgi:hypothetical protein